MRTIEETLEKQEQLIIKLRKQIKQLKAKLKKHEDRDMVEVSFIQTEIIGGE